jgi:30S ribosomal protein S31
MGKGDKKSKKGKIWRGSHGKTRPRHHKKQKVKEKTKS